MQPLKRIAILLPETMPKLIDYLKTQKLTLIASLPNCTLEYAAAAIGGGVDAISFAVDSFDKYSALKDNIAQIIDQSPLPFGLVISSTKGFKVSDLRKLVASGIDFIGIPIENRPAALKNQTEIAEVYILDKDFTIDEILNIEKKDNIILEAKINKTSEVGQELTVGDLQNFITMATSTDFPIVITTQKKIYPSEIPIIWDTGVKGVEITKIVTGKTLKSFQKAVRDFRLAIDDLGE